ncbi:hypothetical protein [Roseococcus pinisoli]|uniref:Uncharacterized protein n=1 Tax=Roseococcus pinisoli TaxID=2835040 RepID=A0ABS5QH71_9PROT|nr:hypothetical protein [Roseococcus pinisoli]MBS7812300.1 hypothetical protein [Roseococcus pinisoli]
MNDMQVGRIEFGPADPHKRAQFEEMLRKAKEWFDGLSPVDQALHRAEQRRSMIRGLAGQDPGPGILVEEVKRLRALVVSLGGTP